MGVSLSPLHSHFSALKTTLEAGAITFLLLGEETEAPKASSLSQGHRRRKRGLCGHSAQACALNLHCTLQPPNRNRHCSAVVRHLGIGQTLLYATYKLWDSGPVVYFPFVQYTPQHLTELTRRNKAWFPDTRATFCEGKEELRIWGKGTRNPNGAALLHFLCVFFIQPRSNSWSGRIQRPPPPTPAPIFPQAEKRSWSL